MLMNRRIDRTMMILALIAVLIFTYFGFSPPYHHYLPLIAKSADPQTFPLDTTLANSTYIKASIYYSLIRWLHLPITSDLVGLTLHISLNLAVVLLATSVVRARLADGDSNNAFLVVLLSCFFYSKLVEGARSTPISTITPTPTGIGHLLAMTALLLAMARRPALAAIAATLCLAVAPKGNVLLPAALLLWPMFDRTMSRKAAAWALVPLGYVAYMAIGGQSASGSPADRAFMLEQIMLREEGDGLFLHQPWLTNVLLPAAMIATPWLIRRFSDPTARAMAWALLLPTAIGWLLMLVYPLGVQTILPIPALVMVSIPQATKPFIWLFAVMLCLLILRNRNLVWYEKTGLLLGIFVVKPLVAHVLLAIGLAIAVLLAWLVRRRMNWEPRFDFSQSRILVPLVLAFLFLRVGITYPGPAWIDKIGFVNSGTWSAMVFADDDSWKAWRSLKAEPDFPLLAIYENKARDNPHLAAHRESLRYVTHTYPNVISGKTPFWLLPAHGYGNRGVWDELQKREILIRAVMENLNNGHSIGDLYVGTVPAIKEGTPIRVEGMAVDLLHRHGAGILVPQELSPLFPPDLYRRQFGTHVLIRFGENIHER